MPPGKQVASRTQYTLPPVILSSLPAGHTTPGSVTQMREALPLQVMTAVSSSGFAVAPETMHPTNDPTARITAPAKVDEAFVDRAALRFRSFVFMAAPVRMVTSTGGRQYRILRVMFPPLSPRRKRASPHFGGPKLAVASLETPAPSSGPGIGNQCMSSLPFTFSS